MLAWQRYYRALVWEEPDGLAFEVLQLSLCRRAAALHRRFHPQPDERAAAMPAWADCELPTSLERLLFAHGGEGESAG